MVSRFRRARTLALRVDHSYSGRRSLQSGAAFLLMALAMQLGSVVRVEVSVCHFDPAAQMHELFGCQYPPRRGAALVEE